MQNAAPSRLDRPYARWSSSNVVILILFVIAAGWSAKGVKVDLGTLLGAEGRTNMWRFISGLFPPDLSAEFLVSLVGPAVETLQMALLGVVLGALAAFPLSFFATRTLSASQTPGVRLPSRIVLGHIPYLAARNFLNLMRSVPELVWALIFIAAVGLGAFPGVLALAVHSAGLLGKLYAENMEGVNPRPVEAVRALGGNRVKVASWALLPQAYPYFVSITLYQWECNVRTATILGFVGAGGIGQRIDIAMRLFRYNEMLTLMAVVFGMVFLVDNLSAFIRRRVALDRK